MADGKRPLSVGFFFSLGHSTIMVTLTLLLPLGLKAVGAELSNDSTPLHQYGGLIGYDEAALEEQLDNRGFMARILGPALGAITSPWQIYPVGVLFGLGFDTVTEVTLLVLAGTNAAPPCPGRAVI
jgi:high-affinity nickel-transport protein